ncbi:tape measure protein [Phocoenobacter skyensis]|uniref:Tape measure domain-containing protein n=1 Tax=Phocoenobacter skyensis TaxID=97481 RepID=A0A1H8A550_9PAST|nr:tape measure protein [Pasteurella skyensis]QLB23318.1 hypothetical protein A6B44_08910 [Pasteurella skyensis]SEM65636.1 tape measure domain-containing protein [Pasteurella skyensis]
MIANELVTVLEYRLKNNKDMQKFIKSVEIAKKKVEILNKSLNKAAKTSGLSDSLKKTQKVVDELQKKVDKGAEAYNKANNGATRLHNTQRRVTRSANKMAKAYSRLGGYIRMALVAMGGLSVTRLMDESASIKGRLAISADEGNADYVRKQVYENSINSGTDFESNIDLFGSVARNKQALGISDQDAVRLADIVGKSVAMTGGKNPGTDAAAIQQFSQSLSAGTLRGDELRSILENSNGLAKAIADSFGISVGELKEMGEKGLLSSKKMVKGLLAQGDKIDKKFSLIPKRFGQGWTNLHTILVEKIAKPLNEMTQWGQKFYELTTYISDNFQEIAAKVGSAGILGSFLMLNSMLKRTNNKIIKMYRRVAKMKGPIIAIATAFKKMLLPMLKGFLKASLLMYGMYLIGEDILVWMQGGNSLIGDWVGSFEEVRKSLEWILDPLSEFFEYLGGAGPAIANIIAIASVLSVVLRVVSLLKTAFALLAPLLAGLSLPVLAVLAVIAALAYAGYLIYDNWEGITKWFKDMWSLLKTYTVAGILKIGAAILDYFTPMWWFYKIFAKVLSWFGVDLPDNLSDAFKNALNNIKNIILSFSPIKWFKDVFSGAFDWISKKIDKIVDSFKLFDFSESSKNMPSGLKNALKANQKIMQTGKAGMFSIGNVSVQPPGAQHNKKVITTNQTNHQTVNVTTAATAKEVVNVITNEGRNMVSKTFSPSVEVN